MPRQIQDRREDGRKRIPEFVGAEIAFNASDGTSHQYPLIELSVAGASFELPERIRGLDTETTCDSGRICVGEIEIHVNMQICHVTRGEGTRYECGVRLFPISDEDRNEMAALIARLTSVPV